MRTFLIWALQTPLALGSSVLCWVLAPLVAIPYRVEKRTDVVKRFGKQVTTMNREYLLPWLSWFGTHDNAADEWWWGMYNTDFYLKRVREWTQSDYDSSWGVRYFCRLAWLIRNPAYGFAHNVLCFKREPGFTSSEQRFVGERYDVTLLRWRNPGGRQAINLKGNLYLSKSWCINFNLGYKAHKGFMNLMHADRIRLKKRDE